jgi:hypothetical protein
MYVVIVCAHCNGSSQVDETLIGQAVQCPLCGKPTVARTPEAILPVARPLEAPMPAATPEAPLSLDDAPPLPPLKSERSAPRPDAPKPPRAKQSPLRTAVYAGTSLILTLLLMALIYWGFRYRSHDIPLSAWSWQTFKPPEGKCTIDFPGEPEAEDIPAGRFGILGGKRFVVKQWLERFQITLAFGWADLDADKWLLSKFDQAVIPIRDAEARWLEGKVTGEATVNFVVGKRKFEARQYQIDAGEAKAQLQIYFDSDSSHLLYHDVEETLQQEILTFAPMGSSPTGFWLPIEIPLKVQKRVVEPGQSFRLWFASVSGKKITPETKWLPKFFNSFVPQ